MSLLLEPLKKAIASLERSLKKPKDEFVRDSVVKRFEYTYELAWKVMQRWIKENVGPEVSDVLTRKELFRNILHPCSCKERLI